MFKKAHEKGQSLVEVALAMPVLILIVMGILDVGRAYFTYVALTDAAAEGAAYAAIHPADTLRIVERATDSSNGLVMLEPQMVHVVSGDTMPGSPITVTVTYDYQILTPIMSSLVPEGRLTMRAVVVQPIVEQ